MIMELLGFSASYYIMAGVLVIHLPLLWVRELGSVSPFVRIPQAVWHQQRVTLGGGGRETVKKVQYILTKALPHRTPKPLTLRVERPHG